MKKSSFKGSILFPLQPKSSAEISQVGSKYIIGIHTKKTIFWLFARIQVSGHFPMLMHIFSMGNVVKRSSQLWLQYKVESHFTHPTSSNTSTLALFSSSSFTISMCPCSVANINGDLPVCGKDSQTFAI